MHVHGTCDLETVLEPFIRFKTHNTTTFTPLSTHCGSQGKLKQIPAEWRQGGQLKAKRQTAIHLWGI